MSDLNHARLTTEDSAASSDTLNFEPTEIVESVASTLSQIDMPEWLIHRLIECGTLGQIYSDWNVGKSALAVDIACRVATECDFAGRKVRQGPVLYIATEGSRGLKRRFKGWSEYNGVEIPRSIYRTLITTRLPEPETERKIRAALAHIEAQESGPLLLVIIDTLAQTMVGEQNSTTDMDRFTALLRELFPHSAVMLLHHVGHGTRERSRGASSLPAACDWEFQLEDLKELADEDDVIKLIRLKNTKQRDEEQQGPFYFSLVRVALDVDQFDQPHTTVVPKYRPDFSYGNKLTKRWGPTANRMLEILDQLTEEQQEKLGNGEKNPDQAGIRTEDWRDHCINSNIKQAAFRQVKSRLLRDKEIEVNKDYVSRTQV